MQKSGISAENAALLGFVPGLGEFLIGNEATGAVQATLFWGSLIAGGHVASQKGYIDPDQRDVKFNLGDVLIGRALADRGMLYPTNPAYALSPFPAFSETAQQRDLRLIKDGKIGEMNPLVEYGEYSRTNTRTAMADSYGLMAQSTLFYSVYSSYRDAGRGRQGETLDELLAAPFTPQYVLSPYVLVPLAVLAGSLSATGPSHYTTLVNDRYMTDGTREFLTVYQSMNAAVAEESFFRGYLNDLASRNLGPWMGGFISGTAFGLAHTVNGIPVTGVGTQVLAGYYLAFLQNKNQGDIREGIAVHFWWDVIIFAAQFRAYKADSRYGVGPREANFMPFTYTMRF